MCTVTFIYILWWGKWTFLSRLRLKAKVFVWIPVLASGIHTHHGPFGKEA